MQRADPSLERGANDVCLGAGRENFGNFGAAEAQYLGFVREPRPEEVAGRSGSM